MTNDTPLRPLRPVHADDVVEGRGARRMLRDSLTNAAIYAAGGLVTWAAVAWGGVPFVAALIPGAVVVGVADSVLPRLLRRLSL
jgi:hypothetical protein